MTSKTNPPPEIGTCRSPEDWGRFAAGPQPLLLLPDWVDWVDIKNPKWFGVFMGGKYYPLDEGNDV